MKKKYTTPEVTTIALCAEGDVMQYINVGTNNKTVDENEILTREQERPNIWGEEEYGPWDNE